MRMVYFLLCLTFSIASPVLIAANEQNVKSVRLIRDWEFVRGDLGGVWEALRSDKLSGGIPVWQKVELPHCYNAFDSVDPDVPYYEGPAWYRTPLKIDNPYPNGRTLLHFEGVGQKAEVYIDTFKIGSHTGGYDEFMVDITDAVKTYQTKPCFKEASPDRISLLGTVPLSIRCDNSRDLETIPSDLSDFCRYGGLYRYVNLVYVPAVSLERIYILPQRQKDGTWQLTIQGRLYNPQSLDDTVTVKV
jgi:beta-galactosidase